MRKSWKMLLLAGSATVALQFTGVGALQAQTGGLVGGTGGLVGGTTAGTTTGAPTTGGATTGGAVPTPIPLQPRFTG